MENKREKVRQKMPKGKWNQNVVRLILVCVVMAILIIVLLVEAFKDRTKGETMAAYEICTGSMALSGPDYTEVFKENYIAYLYKAYIVFGEYPDYELYKIDASLGRDDYDFENDFYVGEGDLYKNYFIDGVKAENSKVAIDISEYQGDIDFEKVKAAGVDVVMIRAGFRGYGSGTIVADENLAQNITGAKAAGLLVGVYFFSQAINYEEGKEEAEFVLDEVKQFDLDEPIVCDTEYIYTDDTARGNEITAEDRTSAILGFCETIAAAGKTPMIYATKSWLFQYCDFEQIGKYEIWMAAYYDDLVFPYHTEGWQYTPEGYVDGIDTQVDLNVWLR